MSGLHFVHWKAAVSSNKEVECHAMLTQIILQSGTPIKWWSKGLHVILQKISVNINMEKQRVLLLIEVDFNFNTKLYFGSRIIKQATGHGLVPPEHHGLQDQNCLEVVLTKTLFNDMMRYKRWS